MRTRVFSWAATVWLFPSNQALPATDESRAQAGLANCRASIRFTSEQLACQDAGLTSRGPESQSLSEEASCAIRVLKAEHFAGCVPPFRRLPEVVNKTGILRKKIRPEQTQHRRQASRVQIKTFFECPFFVFRIRASKPLAEAGLERLSVHVGMVARSPY